MKTNEEIHLDFMVAAFKATAASWGYGHEPRAAQDACAMADAALDVYLERWPHLQTPTKKWDLTKRDPNRGPAF